MSIILYRARTHRHERREDPYAARWSIDTSLFFAWLFVAPLAAADNKPWLVAIVLTPLFVSTGLAALRRLDAFELRWSMWEPWPWIGLFLAVLIVQFAPVGTRPPTLDPYRTTNYFLLAIGCTCIIFLVSTLSRDPVLLRRLLSTLVWAGGVHALIAIAMLAADIRVDVLGSPLGAPTASGTFANRNQLAGYLNLCFAAGLGLLIGGWTAAPFRRSWRQRMRDGLVLLLGDATRIRLLLILIVIGLILSRSRMGNASFVIGMLFATACHAAWTRGSRKIVLIVVASIVLVDLGLIGAWVGIDRVVARVASTPLTVHGATPVAGGEESVADRLGPGLDAWQIVREHPFFGTGGGTFELAFRSLSPRPQGYYLHAANDYLEIASEVGLVGLLALIMLAVVAVVRSLVILRTGNDSRTRAAAVASLMGVVCCGLHGWVDFNLHAPLIALMMSVIVALPFAVRPPAPAADRRVTAHRRPLGRVITPCVTVGLVAAAVVQLRHGLSDALVSQVHQVRAERLRQNAPLPQRVVAELEGRLRRAIAIAPRNAEAFATLGGVLLEAGRADQALDALREAVRLVPAFGLAWIRIVHAKQQLAQIDSELGEAMLQAIRHAGTDPAVMRTVDALIASRSSDLGPAAQAAATLIAERHRRAAR